LESLKREKLFKYDPNDEHQRHEHKPVFALVFMTVPHSVLRRKIVPLAVGPFECRFEIRETLHELFGLVLEMASLYSERSRDMY
jgi:hypothetical protein